MGDQTVIVIPARLGSTRLPRKPLQLVGGKPLIWWVYQRACQLKSVSRVLVATDHPSIARVVQQAGGEALLTPRELHNGSERVAWVASDLNAAVVVNIQADEPFFDLDGLSRAIKFMENHPEVPVATLVTPLREDRQWQNPSVVKVVVSASGRALYFTRQPIPAFRDKTFRPLSVLKQHIGIYLYRRETLLNYARWPISELEEAEQLEQLRFLENDVPIFVVEVSTHIPGVDTPADLRRANEILQKQKAIL